MFHKGCRQLGLHPDISLFSLNSSQGLSPIHHGRAEVQEELCYYAMYLYIGLFSDSTSHSYKHPLVFLSSIRLYGGNFDLNMIVDKGATQVHGKYVLG